MKFKKQSFYQSIRNAERGIKAAVCSERNLKVQLIILVLIVILGWLLEFSQTDWMILVLISVLVLSTEMMNTAVETTVDLFCQDEYNDLAKKAKDIAAGAVLIVSIASLIIGGIIIIPKIINIIT